MAYELDILGAMGGSHTFDYLLWAILALILVFAVFGLFKLIMWILSFNIKCEITKETSNGQIVYKDMAKEVKKDGKTRWEFYKYKFSDKKRAMINPPDKQYIDLLKGGKYFCRFKEYKGNLIPVHPEVAPPTEQQLKLSTLSVEDRNATVEDIHDAYDKHKNNSIMQVIEKFMPVITIVILTIMLMIGMNEFAKAQQDIQDSQKKVVDSINKAIETTNEMMSNIANYEQTGNFPQIIEKPVE